jgi:pimeloyl-ACP methyl ester carboxylesterase
MIYRHQRLKEILMKRLSALVALLTGLLLAACGAQSTAPSPGATALVPTAAPAAIATPAPTQLEPTAKPAVRAVTFSAADVTLTGTLYGGGTTAIILSNMGDNDPSTWEAFAPKLAARGYTVLTYTFRYPSNTSKFDSGMANHTVDDLRAAIAFVHEQGAQKLVLMGASLGGMATAKAAAVEKPTAIVILSAPVDLLEFEFQVAKSELEAITAPKLFIGSEDDKTVPFDETRQMFDLAPDPKELHTYPGAAHGVQLFATDHSDDLEQRLIAFITSNAPPV